MSAANTIDPNWRLGASWDCEREVRKLRVHGTRGAGLAEIKFEAAEGGAVEVLDFLGEVFQTAGLLDAGEGEVRGVGARFGLDAERGEGGVGVLGERGEERVGLDANPEHAGALTVGEEFDLTQLDGDRRTRGQVGQRRDEFGEAVFGPLADEFGGDVEILGSAPGERRKRAHLAEDAGEVVEEVVGQVDGGEEAHARSLILR